MRRPIQIQLLVPMLSVVVLAIALASAAGGYLGGLRARRQQEDNLRRVVATLTNAPFPLTEWVLKQMSGLSGAEFVALDDREAVEATTLAVSPDDVELLRPMRTDVRREGLSEEPVVVLGDKRYLGHRVPVARRFAGARPGSLIVLYPEERWRGGVRQAVYPALLAGSVGALAAVLVTTLLARRFVRPIKRLGDQTAAIAGGQFQTLAVPGRDDEIRDLTLSINEMTQRLSRYEAEVRQNERLRTLGQLGAGLAHQLRNSATGARMAIELHQRECPAGDEAMPVALRQLRLMESYVLRFLSLDKSRPAPHEDVDLGALLEDVIGLVQPTCTHSRIELLSAIPAERLVVRGDAESLRELLVNLVHNAVEAVHRQGDGAPRIEVQLARKTGEEISGGQSQFSSDENGTVPLPKAAVIDSPAPRGSGLALLQVSDSGPGLSEEAGRRLFEPFFTEKPEGTGLGLFVARQIAEAHGGTIGWKRCEGMTWFSVELPLERVETSPRRGTSPGARAETG